MASRISTTQNQLSSCRRQEFRVFREDFRGAESSPRADDAVTALLASLQDAVAKKPDPALLIGLEAASTADIEDIVTIGINIGGQIGRRLDWVEHEEREHSRRATGQKRSS
jgi:hypothetical protein